MPSGYPSSIDAIATDKADSTTMDDDHAAHHNLLASAVNAVETELGTNPSGSQATVAAAFTEVDSRYRQLISTRNVRCLASVVTGAAVYVDQLGGNIVAQSGAASPVLLRIEAASLAVSGRSTKLRVVASAIVNDTAPATTLTLGLYPVGTPSGGVGVLNPNFGAVTTGTTVAFTTPAANSKSVDTATSDIALPADGWYGLGVASAGAMTANSQVNIAYRVEIRNV